VRRELQDVSRGADQDTSMPCEGERPSSSRQGVDAGANADLARDYARLLSLLADLARREQATQRPIHQLAFFQISARSWRWIPSCSSIWTIEVVDGRQCSLLQLIHYPTEAVSPDSLLIGADQVRSKRLLPLRRTRVSASFHVPLQRDEPSLDVNPRVGAGPKTREARPAPTSGDRQTAPAVAYDIMLGGNGRIAAVRSARDVSGRRVAIDLNQTHTLSLFGVRVRQEHTLGTIAEMASLPIHTSTCSRSHSPPSSPL